ncbi:unnamed protein product [Zymoseptoria tritici ST99CH_1A5]|uniref:tyrosinase n=1 Tax=Zymoseptoria tritici ST99CH_1A5 TaxID=1276529 RepID=A0A1Y6LX52_ZYMTR|nr:unnamed protein product [Zymoseptoria tritici ST99CH_1A5]
MLFTTSFAAGVTLFAAAVSASASSDFSSPSPPHAFAKRQAGSVDITTGATGGVQPRLEIGNLATRPDEWSLYIQAMSKWQQAGADDMDGYYGVSSIHGVPYEDANGVSKCDTCSNAMGFGTHDMIIFPTWHRVYLAHFEQKFLAIAQTVAQSYPAASRDRMVAAAGVLRLPFWDWASTSESNSTTLPTYITESQITIEGPNGQETIDNPLYKFSFTSQEVSSNYYEVFTTWLQTYRYPSTNGNSAESNNDQAAANMAAQSASLRDQVYQLLTACDDWMHFSNDQAGATAKCANSIESIHNNVHTLAGGAGANGVSGGHLTYLPLSTYDPIFWLHHANVDRIIALWQTIHADKWGASQTAPHSTWTIPTGAQLNMDYPLKPFNKDANSYWTSNDAKDWTNLGYDYPEFTTSDGSKNSITKFVNALYGRSPSLTAGSISAQIASPASNETTSDSSSNAGRGTASKNNVGDSSNAGSSNAGSSDAGSSNGGPLGGSSNSGSSSSNGGPLGGLLDPITGSLNNLTRPGSNSLLPSGTQAASGIKPPGYPTSSGFFPLISSLVGGVDNLMESFLDSSGAAYEYACNIQTPRYALNGSYYVFVFNGAPSSDNPSTWVTDDNLAGMMGVLANPEGMAGNDLIVTGSIPLTRALRSKVTIGNLLNMAFDIILPYLTKNVEWRIVKDGQEVDVDSVEGFKASVYSSLTSQSNDIGSLPTWSDFTPQLDVTKDKKGGANEAIFGSVEQNQAGNSVSVPGYGGSPSGGDSSDSGSSSGGGSSDSGSSSDGDSSDNGSSSSAPSYDSGNSGSSTANANAPAYATKAHGSAPAYGTDIVPGTATPSSMGAPSGPATAPAEAAPTEAAPTEEACVAITTTTTVQETETVYVTASSTPEAAVETHPAIETQPAAYSSAPAPAQEAPPAAYPSAPAPAQEAPPAAYPSAPAPAQEAPPAAYPSAPAPPVETISAAVESHPIASSPAGTQPIAAPYPVPSAASSSEADAIYPTPSAGNGTAPMYHPTGTGGQVNPTKPVSYTGAASSVKTAGVVIAGMGAMIAFCL